MKHCISVLASLLLVLAVQAQTVVAGEYFVDTDPGFGSGVSFTGAPVADGSFSFAVNTGALAVGFYKLYIRTRGSDGRWSHTIRKDFEILPVVPAAGIASGEYFFDSDPGVGGGTGFSIVPTADDRYSFAANTPAPTGFHKLYIRTKDNNDKWSHTTRQDVEVLPAITTPNITTGEYFIDTDPGFGSASPFTTTPATDGSFPFPASITGLSKGYHKLFARTKEDNGKWSLTARKDIEVLQAVPPFVITAGEYFFDSDPGIGNGVSFSFNPADTNVTKTLALPIGCANIAVSRMVFFRVKDSKGDWSNTVGNSFLPKDAATVTTVASGLWSNPATWSNGMVPQAGTSVILNHNITVDVDATCYLLRSNCHTITVSNGKKLLVTGN